MLKFSQFSVELKNQNRSANAYQQKNVVDPDHIKLRRLGNANEADKQRARALSGMHACVLVVYGRVGVVF